MQVRQSSAFAQLRSGVSSQWNGRSGSASGFSSSNHEAKRGKEAVDDEEDDDKDDDGDDKIDDEEGSRDEALSCGVRGLCNASRRNAKSERSPFIRGWGDPTTSKTAVIVRYT